jgi:hypothetical protein
VRKDWPPRTQFLGGLFFCPEVVLQAVAVEAARRREIFTLNKTLWELIPGKEKQMNFEIKNRRKKGRKHGR